MGQLIRFKGNVGALGVEEAEAEAAAEAAVEAAAVGDVTDELKSWRALTEGRFVALRLKTDAKTVIQCAEVVSVDRRDSDNEVEVWYYLDRHESPYNDFEMPLNQRKLVAEWYGPRQMGWCISHPARGRLRAASSSSVG